MIYYFTYIFTTDVSNEVSYRNLSFFVETLGSKKYWTKGKTQPTSPPEPMPFYRRQLAPSYDIEMTSYGLLVYALKGQITEGTMVAGWLSLQRNSLGGYRSTQVMIKHCT